MIEWIVSRENKLEQRKVDKPQEAYQTKIKVSAAALSQSDVVRFNNSIGNFAPCKRAVGYISVGGENSDFKIGERVVVDPFLTDDKKQDYNVSIMGVNTNGLMGDFIYIPTENIYRLPIGIPDTEAVYAETIATSLAILHKMKVQKGDYVVIMGCGISDLYLAKLCIYYQFIPIVVDDVADRLKIASECGVYYTIDRSTSDLMATIQSITGGRMTDFLVFDKGDANALSYTQYVHRGGTLCIRDEIGVDETLTLNVDDICRRELNVTGVYNGAKYFPSAINLLAMHAVELIAPDVLTRPFDKAVELIQTYAERKDDPVKAILTF